MYYRLFFLLFLVGLTPVDALAQLPFSAKTLFAATPTPERLEQVNLYFNDHFEYRIEKSNVWLSRERFIEQGGGDCEDFALSKYQTLIETGIPATEFRFVYARLPRSGQHHIALLHLPSGKLLDNLTSDTRPLAQRQDLIVLFQFTANALYPSTLKRLSRAQLRTLQHWQASIRQAEPDRFAD